MAFMINHREELSFLSKHWCSFKTSQSEKPELQSMEGTLERKHKLQLGGKKVGEVPFSISVSMVSSSKACSQQHALLSYFHRRPPEAGAPTMPSCTDTPCASTRTERRH